MAVLEISVVPIGTKETSLSEYVKASVVELEKMDKDVKYELTAMGTIIEGQLDDLLEIVRIMHESPFQKGVERVVTSIKIDDRRDSESTISQKVESVKKKF